MVDGSTLDKVLNALVLPVILLFLGYILREPISKFYNWIRGFIKSKEDVEGEGFGGIEYE